jgi:hypothetical protein
MERKAIVEALANKKPGQFFSVEIRRAAKVLKGVTEDIEKLTKMTGQLCDYSARGPVKTAIAEGTRDAPELPSHIASSFREGNVKFWEGKNGKIYLPMPLSGNHSTVVWFLNGVEVPYDDVEGYLLAADKPKKRPDAAELAEKGQVAFAGVDIDNIVAVH